MDTLVASRLVTPGTTRLPISDGDFLIVKQRLNAGETMDMFERAAPDGDLMAPGARATRSLAIVTAYLLDWSLTDFDGAVIPIRGVSADEKAAAIRLLDFESLIEITNAITAHDTVMRQEKKRPAAVIGSSPP